MILTSLLSLFDNKAPVAGPASVYANINNPNTPLGWEAIVQAIESRGGGITDAGIVVSPDVALRFGAVYACTRIIAGTLGSLPLKIYKRKKSGGRDEATDHRLYPVLHDRPNEQMSSMVWREATQCNTLLWGKGFGQLQYDNAGRVVGIWPRLSSMTSAVRDSEGFYFKTYDTPDGAPLDIPADEMLYFPGMGFNGVEGFSVVGYARQAIALGLAAEKFGARLFANGVKGAGVLMIPGKLSEPAQKNLIDSFEKKHQGADNAHKTIVLEEGVKYQQTSIPPDDAQFLETRKYQRSEIAGWFGVPPHMIGDLERATFSNIEQQDLEFTKHCIRPWLVRWEQELNWKLFQGTDFFTEFSLEGLLRGDFKTRQEGLAIQRQNGIIDTNEWRSVENMNAVDDADNIRIVPANFTTPEKLAAGDPPDVEQDQTDQDPADGNQEAAAVQRIRAAMRPVMQDAVGRMLHRAKASRDVAAAVRIFAPALCAIRNGVWGMDEYCTALSMRAQNWTADQAETITDEELAWAFQAAEGKQ